MQCASCLLLWVEINVINIAFAWDYQSSLEDIIQFLDTTLKSQGIASYNSMQTKSTVNVERHWPFAHEMKKKIEKLKHEIEFMQRKCPKRFGWQMNKDIKMIHPCQVLKIYLGFIWKFTN